MHISDVRSRLLDLYLNNTVDADSDGFEQKAMPKVTHPVLSLHDLEIFKLVEGTGQLTMD